MSLSPQLCSKVYKLYRLVLLIDESTEFAYLDYIPSHITNLPLICMLCSALVQLRFTVHYRPHLLFQASITKLSVHKRRTLTSTTMHTVKKVGSF
jgi:hypothetical protein